MTFDLACVSTRTGPASMSKRGGVFPHFPICHGLPLFLLSLSPVFSGFSEPDWSAASVATEEGLRAGAQSLAFSTSSFEVVCC